MNVSTFNNTNGLKKAKLYDEVFDSDANISGVILEFINNSARVLWSNCVVGLVDFEKCQEVLLTGKNYSNVPTGIIINKLEGATEVLLSDYEFFKENILTNSEFYREALYGFRDKDWLINRYIPSATVQSFIQQQKWDFSDSEWATIIYNSMDTISQKHTILELLGLDTLDKKLFCEIKERLAYDNMAFELFCNDSDGYTYVVLIDGEAIAAVCDSFIIAYKTGCRYIEEFTIEKHAVQYEDSKPATIRSIESSLLTGGEPAVKEETLPPNYYIPPVAGLTFDAKGCLIRYFSSETSAEQALNIEGMEPNRFEYRFIEVPNPFEEGNKVKLAIESHYNKEQVYTVLTSQNQWNAFINDPKKRKLSDWSDASIIITAKPDSFDHEHINPIFLELVDSE
ncbi:hypothetical protein [Pseudobutyrivibrio sp. LB2011]|uniref:hypothetical protein n=1 Tax=Pseudobutyrivibrio sp. LB2011 TaxID=1408312 RepID=UPI0005D1810E|nr:hypothetical protein [Pseudobutyrivibrio sp. LB2011]